MACARDKGIFVPAGIVITFRSEAAAVVGLGATTAAELAAALSGFCTSAACPNAIPEIRTTVKSPRIGTSKSQPISPRIPSNSAPTMQIHPHRDAWFRDLSLRPPRKALSPYRDADYLINQIFLPNQLEFLQLFLPILRYPPRIFPCHQSIVSRLIHQQLRH